MLPSECFSIMTPDQHFGSVFQLKFWIFLDNKLLECEVVNTLIDGSISKEREGGEIGMSIQPRVISSSKTVSSQLC